MPKANDEKTKWARKPLIVLIVLTVLTLVVGLVVYINRPAVKVNGHQYNLLIASTQATREKGLGDRKNLPQNEAMLFVFQDPAVQCFWMKDMQFPLDMVWLNTDKQVVHIENNVSPRSYPHLYCPAASAAYVLEFNAGQVAKSGLRLSEQVQF